MAIAVIKLTFFLFLFTNCQEKEARKEVIKSPIKDTIFNDIQDKLAYLGIHYKYYSTHYNQAILDPEDSAFHKMRLNPNNLKIPYKSVFFMDLDSNKVYAGYSLNKLSNGRNIIGFAYNLDVGTYIDFVMYDNYGKPIKPLLNLASVWNMGFFHTNYAFIKNDTINIYAMRKKPISYQNGSKTNFEYINYIIHFDKNGNVLLDTLSKIKLDTTVSDIEKNKLKTKFYATKKAYKQQILDEEFRDKN